MSAAADSDCPLQKRQLFGFFDDFQLALDDWAVQTKFGHRSKEGN